MNLGNLISSNAVILNEPVKSKKRALEVLASQLAEQIKHTHDSSSADSPESEDSVDALDIFQLLTEREKLGSTGLGHGVALPHARTELTDTAVGAFLRLDHGIDFDSPDSEATDLMFALVVPEHYTDEHLKILAHLASLFSNDDYCSALRGANSSNELYDHLIHWQISEQAS